MSPAPPSHLQPGSFLDRAEACKAADTSARKIAYDECTVRMMFIEMDAKANGTVSKEEFINFLRNQRQLQNVLYGGLKPEAVEQDASSSKISPQIARAMGIKRIISVYKDMSRNQNGVVTWDEFLDFFRRTGLLLVYLTPDNPRDRMAAALASEYQQRVTQKGAEALRVGQQKRDTSTEGLTGKFLVDQREQQQNTQWAGEKLSHLQEQSSKGKDALSIAMDSIDAMRKAAKARQIINKYTQSPVDGSIQPATQSENAITEDEKSDGSKPLPAATPHVQPTSPAALKLPSLLQPIVNDAVGKASKSLFIRNGRSYSTVCEKSPSSKCQFHFFCVSVPGSRGLTEEDVQILLRQGRF